MKASTIFTFDSLQKTTTVVGVVYSLAVLASSLLTGGAAVGKTFFVLYLVRQAWVEAVVVFGIVGGIIAYRALRGSTTIRKETLEVKQGMSRSRGRLVPLRVIGQAIAIVLLSYCVITSGLLFVRARVFFWTRASTRSFVEEYRKEIDRLGRNGRIEDASDLGNRVQSALGDTVDTEILEGRRARLDLAIKRSKALFESTSTSSGDWNPVTNRAAYFKLLEAVRVNPQNVRAADRLRKYVEQLKRLLSKDLATVCDQQGEPHDMKLFATPMFDASVIWQKASRGRRACKTYLSDLSSSWNLDAADCILQVSDAARAASDEQAPLVGKIRCLSNPAVLSRKLGGESRRSADDLKGETSEDRGTWSRLAGLALEIAVPFRKARASILKRLGSSEEADARREILDPGRFSRVFHS